MNCQEFVSDNDTVIKWVDVDNERENYRSKELPFYSPNCLKRKVLRVNLLQTSQGKFPARPVLASLV